MHECFTSTLTSGTSGNDGKYQLPIYIIESDTNATTSYGGVTGGAKTCSIQHADNTAVDITTSNGGATGGAKITYMLYKNCCRAHPTCC